MEPWLDLIVIKFKCFLNGDTLDSVAASISRSCAFCGKRDSSERGHIVPRCLFDKQPSIQWTVPACWECERGEGDGIATPISHDEEYLRDFFCQSGEVEGHPVIRALTKGSWRRSLARNPKLVKKLAEGFAWRMPASEEGILLPYFVPTIAVEQGRLERVMRKITRGLYYVNNSQTPIPPSMRIEVFARIERTDFQKFLETFKRSSNTGLHALGGKRVFEYMGARRASPHEAEQYYLMVFYGVHCTMTCVVPATTPHV